MSVNFNQCINENMPFVLAPNKKTENRGFFTNYRVNKETVPDGWYVYEFRNSDSNDRLCTIEPSVMANFGGSFLTRQEIKMNKEGYRSLSCGYTFV